MAEPSAKGWWSIRLGPRFWGVVSLGLLVYERFVLEGYEAKGRAVLILLGWFGLICSAAFYVACRVRKRRDRTRRDDTSN